MLQIRSFVLCWPFSDTLNVFFRTLFSVQYTQIESLLYCFHFVHTNVFWPQQNAIIDNIMCLTDGEIKVNGMLSNF